MDAVQREAGDESLLLGRLQQEQRRVSMRRRHRAAVADILIQFLSLIQCIAVEICNHSQRQQHRGQSLVLFDVGMHSDGRFQRGQRQRVTLQSRNRSNFVLLDSHRHEKSWLVCSANRSIDRCHRRQIKIRRE